MIPLVRCAITIINYKKLNQFIVQCFFDIQLQGAFDNTPILSIKQPLTERKVILAVLQWINAMIEQHTVTVRVGQTLIQVAIKCALAQVSPDASLHDFSVLTVDNVVSMLHCLPDKSSQVDPVPTLVLKQVSDLLGPYITELFNRLLADGHFPDALKETYITPVMKKAGLHTAQPSSYRPISNLPVLSKLLERLVASQL